MYSMYLMSNLVYGINKNQNSLSCGLILRLMSTLIFMLDVKIFMHGYSSDVQRFMGPEGSN